MGVGQKHEQGVVSEDYTVGGVHVVRTCSDMVPARHATPLVLVHGGLHGAWCWDRYAGFLARAGWDCHALDWLHHGGSRSLPADDFLQRGIADVRHDISAVTSSLSPLPAIVAHSMGGLAALKFAEHQHVAAMALLTPALPRQAEPDVIDLPVNPDEPWGPPPFELARNLFFQRMSNTAARGLYERLVPESPRAVTEVTREWSVDIEPARVSGPVLVMAAELDMLSDPAAVHRLARMVGADYRFAHDRGHSLIFDDQWLDTARLVEHWLRRQLSSTGSGAVIG